MVLKDIPAEARPREKLQSLGAPALADAELIALLLRTGLPGVSVLQLAQQLLDEFNGLGGLLHASANDLKRIKGLGPAKRAEITAVMELARRSLTQELQQRAVLTSPQQVKDLLSLKLAHLGHELFVVLFLNAQHQLLEFNEMFRGTLAQASAVIFAHNHPSGVAEPSSADEYLTQTLKAALQLIDVRVLDHLVVGHSGVVSFAERGLL